MQGHPQDTSRPMSAFGAGILVQLAKASHSLFDISERYGHFPGPEDLYCAEKHQPRKPMRTGFHDVLLYHRA